MLAFLHVEICRSTDLGLAEHGSVVDDAHDIGALDLLDGEGDEAIVDADLLADGENLHEDGSLRGSGLQKRCSLEFLPSSGLERTGWPSGNFTSVLIWPFLQDAATHCENLNIERRGKHTCESLG